MIIVDYYLIICLEVIEECKYVIIVTFYPWIIRRMSEYEGISFFTWTGSSWISYNPLLELFHEYLMHLSEACARIMIYIYEWYIFSYLRYYNTILIWCNIERSLCWCAHIHIGEEIVRRICTPIDKSRCNICNTLSYRLSRLYEILCLFSRISMYLDT